MSLEDLDLIRISKLITQQIDNVTCLQCCKYYIAPETATCGHTLCHYCWKKRRSCPVCTLTLDRKFLKQNLPLQTLTDNVHMLSEHYQKLFNIKLDEFLLDSADNHQLGNYPAENVNDWLGSSQNHFSAPISQTQSDLSPHKMPIQSNQVELSTSKIQVHTNSKKSLSPKKVICVPPPQEDWDKIDFHPDTENFTKDKENVIGPMDIEPYFIDDNEYTVANPRRSSRKKDTKINDSEDQKNYSVDKLSSKDTSEETETKTLKSKQDWSNVKRMRKEFSKLNKKNRNKLNVSIEMCKKSTTSKSNFVTTPHRIEQQLYDIDDNTPKESHDKCTTDLIDTHLNRNSTAANENDLEQVQCSFDQNKFINNTNISNVEKNKKEVIIPVKKTTSKPLRMPFYKKGALYTKCEKNARETAPKCNAFIESDYSPNTDDIEITIKIGNTVANIVIKKKNDIEVKVNTDREVQTSLGQHNLNNNNNNPSNSSEELQNIEVIEKNELTKQMSVPQKFTSISSVGKYVSNKKNTASADTSTAQFEITESVEKELSKVMECVEPNETNGNNECKMKSPKKQSQLNLVPDSSEEIVNCNDIDLFEGESVKGTNVHLLKSSKNTPSEILVCTMKTNKIKTQKAPEKRNRETNENNLPSNKKIKLTESSNKISQATKSPKQTTYIEQESENYDVIMDQVFANIDADIGITQKSDSNKIIKVNEIKYPSLSQKEQINEKYSENVFSSTVKENEDKAESKLQGSTQRHIEDLLTPVLVQDLQASHNLPDKNALMTPKAFVIDEDSESVVEETPQKDVSFLKVKQKSDGSNQSQRLRSNRQTESNIEAKSVININDTTAQSSKSVKDVTVVEMGARGTSLETPLTINKFVTHITHKSTPVARKSLNFRSEDVDDNDPEQTLCRSSDAIAKTTQEKEFMSKAFECSPAVPSPGTAPRAVCVAGSCLTPAELNKLKLLVLQRYGAHHYEYVDKYTKELTHLVVSVDENNKSQRSVKYMCALAAGKWIVSYEWVEKCLEMKKLVPEEPYEVLDNTGEPGPKRSRIAKKKLFEGITFYCMPPFSVLDVDTLKGMVEAAGGQVVGAAGGARVTSPRRPALLLAEPESTQDDKFIYLAMEKSVVPVNFEWVLSCLGKYSLDSIVESLLCPAALLPPATAHWPPELIAREDE